MRECSYEHQWTHRLTRNVQIGCGRNVADVEAPVGVSTGDPPSLSRTHGSTGCGTERQPVLGVAQELHRRAMNEIAHVAPRPNDVVARWAALALTVVGLG